MKRSIWREWSGLLLLIGSGGLSCLAASQPAVHSFSPGGGLVGATVTIHGVNFFNVREVRFNQTPAIFTVDSSLRITATVPLEAMTGPISVITASGVGGSAASFVVAPRITGFSPTSGPPGVTVVVNGANLEGATAVQFGGVNAWFAVVAPTQLQAVVPAQALTGPVAVVTAAGRAESGALFQVTGMEPVISGFTPVRGGPGSQVVIEGVRFTGTTNVLFGSKSASFAVVSDAQVNATVPAGVESGPITVQSKNGNATSATSFEALAGPHVHGFSPERGRAGSLVTIEGENFVDVVRVLFGAVAATSFHVVARTQIQAEVPAGAETGQVKVETLGGSGVSQGEFVVSEGPYVTGFNPGSGRPGDTISISGGNFGPVTEVRFNTNTASFSVVAEGLINAVVPAGATTGAIRLKGSAGEAATEEAFVVLAGEPLVTGFSPRAALPGQLVILEGFNFFNVTAVEFGGVESFFEVPAATQIRAAVPAAALSGPITVKTLSGTNVSEQIFVAAPRITAFEPELGRAEDLVVISGTNFTEVSEVAFGGVPANFEVRGERSLQVVVPRAALTGPISVTTPAGVVSSALVFRMAPTIESFRPISGIPGTVVAISGTGFAGPGSVRFGGEEAEFEVIHSQLVLAVVPPDAETGPIRFGNRNGASESELDFTVAVTADLEMEVLGSPERAVLGEVINYTLTLTNLGPAVATNVILTSEFSAGIEFEEGSAEAGELQWTNGLVQVNWSILSTNTNRVASLRFRATEIGMVTNLFQVVSREFDPDPTNSLVQVVSRVVESPARLSVVRNEGELLVEWPAAASNYVIQATGSLKVPIQWSDPTVAGAAVSSNQVKVPMGKEAFFFRLRRKD